MSLPEAPIWMMPPHSLEPRPRRTVTLRSWLWPNCFAGVAGEYDLVLMDCPPGNEPLQAAAVAASRYALVPLKRRTAVSRDGASSGLCPRAQQRLSTKPREHQKLVQLS